MKRLSIFFIPLFIFFSCKHAIVSDNNHPKYNAKQIQERLEKA
jgi:hypothetical protein